MRRLSLLNQEALRLALSTSWAQINRWIPCLAIPSGVWHKLNRHDNSMYTKGWMDCMPYLAAVKPSQLANQPLICNMFHQQARQASLSER